MRLFDQPARDTDERRRPPLPIAMRYGAMLLALHASASVLLLINVDYGPRPDASLAIEALIDGALAGLLVMGWEHAIALAIARTVFRALLIGGIALAHRAYGLVMIEALGMVAIGLVLMGTPSEGRARIGMGVGVVHELALALALIGGIGLGIPNGPITELTGEHLPYRLTLPPTGWRTPDASTRELAMPDADAWAVRDDIGAEIFVNAQLGADPSSTTLDDLERQALEMLDDVPVAIVDREDRLDGRTLHVVARVGDVGDADAIIGVHLVPGVAYRIVATIDSRRFPESEAELRAIVRSFEPGM